MDTDNGYPRVGGVWPPSTPLQGEYTRQRVVSTPKLRPGVAGVAAPGQARADTCEL